MLKRPLVLLPAFAVATFGVLAYSVASRATFAKRPAQTVTPRQEGNLLVTGKAITPLGDHTGVGSFPFRIATAPGGRFAVVSDMGGRAFVSTVEIGTGRITGQVRFMAGDKRAETLPPRKGLYYGVAFGVASAGVTPVYVSQGADDSIAVLSLGVDGSLTDTGRVIVYPAPETKGSPRNPAGLATSADGKYLYSVDNTAKPNAEVDSVLHVFETATGKQVAAIPIPAYPYALVRRANALYFTSEADGTVSVVGIADPTAPLITRTLKTGANPAYLLLSWDESRLYVSNASSDTVTVINPASNTVIQTMLLRPPQARNLPGCTPLGMAESADGSRLFVALADMNAVAVVSTKTGVTEGYIPTGWYPSDVALSGDSLLVTCARGTQTRNPNGKPVPVAQADFPKRAQYVYNILEGTATRLSIASTLKDLPALTAQVMENNALRGKTDLLERAKAALKNPGIEHVIYVIKENRTYDQVLGDVKRGNGDPSLTLFGRDVTPNQHALAERFVLLDNFYCCAEVSGDGWNWSTAGMASHYVSRNVPYGYSGHTRPYDYEGTNNDIAIDTLGKPDVARPAGGYLWDAAKNAGVTIRNYGFFVTYDGANPRTPEGRTEDSNTGKQVALLNALAPDTDPDFREYDIAYPDSDAAKSHGLPIPTKGLAAFGKYKSPSRIAEFLREYDGFVRDKTMPGLCLLRLPRDHTAGTTAGAPSPRAMVADNDYAVGQLVEAVSKSPYWKKTAIFIVEDDAQNGYDHVDAHRSIAFVISPFVKKNSHDSRFYNTDSTLHTIENLLGLTPMNQYDAVASTINVWTKRPDNDAPYTAILPTKAIVGEINAKTAYRALDSARMLNARREESAPDEELNEILWRNAKGVKAVLPVKRYGVRFSGRAAPFAADGDGD